MHLLTRVSVIAGAMACLAGCSSLSSLNPFSSSDPKLKPAELTPIEISSKVQRVWQADVGSAAEFTFTPAVVGDNIYVAARDGAVSRLDKSGKQMWRISAGQTLSGGVGGDGKRVVAGTPKGEVLVFDAADGRELWRAQVGAEVLAVPVLIDDLIVVRSGDSRIYGFDAVNGKRRWLYQRTTPTLVLRSNVGVWADAKTTLAGFPGGKLMAIANNNGAAMWEGTVALPKGATELERVADVASRPAVGGGAVCAATFQGRISCFDQTNGNVLWSRDMSSSAGLDMDAHHVYVSDDKGAVHALDRSTGASLWKQDKLTNRQLSRPLVLGNEIAVADYQGIVHLLRQSDGALIGRVTTDGSAVRSELVRYGSGALVQTVGGGLFAVDAR